MILKNVKHLCFQVVYLKTANMKRLQTHINNGIAWNVSNTFSDISLSNQAITRNKLFFTGSSPFDIQFLYPLFSELSMPSYVFTRAFVIKSTTE